MNPYKRQAATALLATLAALAASPAATRGDSANTKERVVTKVADGVYVIRHKDAPNLNPQGNTTVIVGGREVLVVDSGYLPSSAREDIAQIRQWTDKPVRFVVNTHWHEDHMLGNVAYRDAFPSVAMIAHRETRRQNADYTPGFLQVFNKTTEKYRGILDSGKNGDKPLTEEEKAYLKKALAGREAVSQEFQSISDRLHDVAPDVDFDNEMDVDLGGREVQIRFLGRGNTVGDAVVYLPKEKIVVTGDLVVHPVPYFFGGFPAEQIQTLKKLGDLEFETLVPGHGEVLKGKAYLQQEIGFLEKVVGGMHAEIFKLTYGPGNLEAVREALHKSVDFKALEQQFIGNNPEQGDRQFWNATVEELITAAYAEMWPR